MMKYKKLLSILLLIGVVVCIMGCVNLDKIVIGNPDLNKKADGVYQGKSKAGPVRVTLDVTVKDGKITAIDIVRHFNGLGKKAETIIPRVIEAQSLAVDVVSGATASSKAILKAIDTALN
ncbi:MAG: FMN-binding protein [Spirochaetaceae bacterium]|jgi:uncharacterized protein with FMN-binding domain|nr:FMN-binding protein [Spirochaetaceae bacterium]